MAILSSFLPHFPRTFLGRAKTSASSRIVHELQKVRNLALPDLAAMLGGLLPDEFFAKAPDSKAKRLRLYPPITLFWAFPFQVLNPAMPCQEVVGKLRAWVLTRRDQRGKPSLSTAAYCQARLGLSQRLLQGKDSASIKLTSAVSPDISRNQRCGFES